MISFSGKTERIKKVKREENENDGKWGESYLTLVTHVKSVCRD